VNLRKDKRFLRCLKGRPDAELAEVLAATQAAASAFGHPHLHRGVGLRVLTLGFYECRAGLKLRLVFEREGSALIFTFAGNHDEVRAFLKGRTRR
jgi:hypothetical protein